MESIIRHIQYIAAVAGAVIGQFLGGWDDMLRALVVFICADYILGLMAAIREKSLSSHVGFKGILRKAAIFVIIGIANELDTLMPGGEHMIRAAACCFYIANEGVSLLENAARIGLPVPERIVSMLEQIKSKDGAKK